MLRGLATLAYALQKTGVSLNRFGRLYIDRNPERADPSGLEKRWASGESVPTRASIERLEGRLPGIELMPIYSHPLFDVLLDQPRSVSQILAICDMLCPLPENVEERSHWRERWDARFSSLIRPSFYEQGPMEVLDRFAFLLLSLRVQEILDNPAKHFVISRYVYECFPFAASVTFLYPHRRLLAHCVDRVHQRSPISYRLCKIDWPFEFERTTATFEMRASGAGHEQIRAYHESQPLSAWSWVVFTQYAAHRPDDVPPKSLIEERWWSGSAMKRPAQSAKHA